jgi:hypothetical protein
MQGKSPEGSTQRRISICWSPENWPASKDDFRPGSAPEA